MKIQTGHICVFLVFLYGMLSPGLSQADGIAVLLSQEITPYVAMVEGLEQRLVNRPVLRFFLDKNGQPYSLSGAGLKLDPAQYTALVSVGPSALRYLQPRAEDVPLLFGMVLNPQNVSPDPENLPCGVSLNIPVVDQFAAMLHNFPWMTRLGVLFDPVNNQTWFDHAIPVAKRMGIELIPLQVNRLAGRLSIVGDFSLPDAIMFIPDKTIIGKAVIQYVIKQAVLQKTPVVGYNQFFYDSGATLAFIIDYQKIGFQVAEQVEKALSGNACSGQLAPAFETKLNPELWRALQLDRKGAEQ